MSFEQEETLRVNSRPKHQKAAWESIDYFPPDAPESSNRCHLFVFEDNETFIKMIMGRSPHIRHVSRARRVDLGWLLFQFEIITFLWDAFTPTNGSPTLQ